MTKRTINFKSHKGGIYTNGFNYLTIDGTKKYVIETYLAVKLENKKLIKWNEEKEEYVNIEPVYLISLEIQTILNTGFDLYIYDDPNQISAEKQAQFQEYLNNLLDEIEKFGKLKDGQKLKKESDWNGPKTYDKEDRDWYNKWYDSYES